MKFACRCSNCEARKSLSKMPHQYARQPQCPSCRKRKWRWDKFRDLVEKKRKPCNCTGYWFAHRKGSGWCDHGKKIIEAMEQEVHRGQRMAV